MPEVSVARSVGRGVDSAGAGMGHASLASYGGGRLSRAGKERTSLAHCVGKGVGGVGVGMGHASLASYAVISIPAGYYSTDLVRTLFLCSYGAMGRELFGELGSP